MNEAMQTTPVDDSRRGARLGQNGERDVAALIGRLMLVAIFFVSAYGKMGGGFEKTATLMAAKGLPAAQLLLVLTIAVELIAGTAIILGWQTRWAAIALFLFTVTITLVFHAFWSAPPEQFQAQQGQFLKNLALCGGLLVLFAFGPGRYAIDRRRGART